MGKEVAVRLRNARRVPTSARRPGLLRRAARLGLGLKAAGEVNVVFVSDREIRRLNKAHLRHDYATDVIAFAYDGDLPAGPAEAPFGDIVISVDRAKAQAAELGHSLLVELVTLAAHGALHLAGYDDLRPAAKKRMFARQDRIVKEVLGR